MQLLVKTEKGAWRNKLLANNTLDGIITLPDELFLPYAQPYTNILLLTRGVPHNFNRPVFFARIDNDGLRLRKNVRVPRPGSQIDDVIAAYEQKRSIDGLCGWAKVASGGEWRPGAYIAARQLSSEEVLEEVDGVIRNKMAFVVRYAHQLRALSDALQAEGVTPRDFHEYVGPSRESLQTTGNTIGAYFEIFYGQKELEAKDRLGEGVTPVISSSAADNGCHGFYDFDWLIKPPFVTVPRTGSIGMAHVQEWACGASSDNLILLPRAGVSIELLYIAAAVIRRERWRFNYGSKITPQRIAWFPVPNDPQTIAVVGEYLASARRVEALALSEAGSIVSLGASSDGEEDNNPAQSVGHATLNLLSEIDPTGSDVRHLTNIRAGGKKYRLSPPVSYAVHAEGIYAVAESEEFHIYADGETPDEAAEEFQRHFAALIEGYALESDAHLARQGQELKQRLLTRLKRV